MKLFKALSCTAAAGLLLSLSNDAGAGTLTVTSGPSFTPAGVATSNTIQVQQVAPELIKIFGNATLVQPASPVLAVSLTLSGNFTANGTFGGAMNDKVSFAYDFQVDLTSAAPVSYTLEVIAMTAFGNFPFSDADNPLQQGTSFYADQQEFTIPQEAFLFGSPLSGTFTANLTFNFSAPATGDTLTIISPNSILFQVAPVAIPEPSTYALLGVGLAGLIFAARRRATA
jgi:hypothetical protein